MYFEIVVILSYIINLFLFFLMINYSSDSLKATLEYKTIFTPIWIALGIHLLYNTCSMIIKEEYFLRHVLFYLFVVSSLAATISICLKIDSKRNIPDWASCLMSIIALIFLFLEFLIHYIMKSDDNDIKNN